VEVKARFPAGADGRQIIPPGGVILCGLYDFRPNLKVTRLYARPKGKVQVMAVAAKLKEFFYPPPQYAL
jgi:hypothetical protein